MAAGCRQGLRVADLLVAGCRQAIGGVHMATGCRQGLAELVAAGCRQSIGGGVAAGCRQGVVELVLAAGGHTIALVAAGGRQARTGGSAIVGPPMAIGACSATVGITFRHECCHGVSGGPFVIVLYTKTC